MNKQTLYTNSINSSLRSEADGIDLFTELALNILWSWNHEADKIWQQLDPALWELTHNPWIILQTVSKDQLERQLANQ